MTKTELNPGNKNSEGLKLVRSLRSHNIAYNTLGMSSSFNCLKTFLTKLWQNHIKKNIVRS